MMIPPESSPNAAAPLEIPNLAAIWGLHGGQAPAAPATPPVPQRGPANPAFIQAFAKALFGLQAPSAVAAAAPGAPAAPAGVGGQQGAGEGRAVPTWEDPAFGGGYSGIPDMPQGLPTGPNMLAGRHLPPHPAYGNLPAPNVSPDVLSAWQRAALYHALGYHIGGRY